MDRSIYSTSTEFGGYNEQSSNTPGFHAIKAQKQQLPVHPYLFERWDGVTPWYFDPVQMGWRNENNNGGIPTFVSCCRAGYYQLQVGGVKSREFDNVERMHKIVLNELQQKVRESPVNLGTSLGEYRETAEMLTGACRKLVPLARALKGKDFSLALRTLTKRTNNRPSHVAKAAADAWLGWTYGVKPLASDINGSLQLLAARNEPTVLVGSEKASYKISVSGNATYNEHYFGDPNEFLYSSHFGEVGGTMSCRGRIDFTVDNPLLFTADQLGLLNPVALGWELIPFSFVFDWFIPVGDYLNNVVPPHGVSNIRGFTYVKAKGWTRRSNVRYPPVGSGSTQARERGFLKERRIFADWPDTSLVIPSIDLKKSQMMSALSLLAQLAP